MGHIIQVVDGSPHEVWVPVTSVGATTMYVGQLVQTGTDGVITMANASGVLDKSTKVNYAGTLVGTKIPFGVVTAVSAANPTYNSTYKRNSVTSVITSNANYTVDMAGVEGGWSKGDKQAYVKVALITPQTILRAPIYLTSFGTAPTVATVASGASSTGMGYTTAATIGFTSVAHKTTAYCRSGANKGIYRVTSDTSTTVKTCTSPFPYAIAVGDTFVHVNLKSFGHTTIALDSLGLFVLAEGDASNNYGVNVINLDLSEAGNEYVDFQFGAYQFVATDYLS